MTTAESFSYGYESDQSSPTQKHPISRWKAAGIHLAISVGLALAVVVLLYYLWYPQPFFETSGGKFLLMVLVGVDVVLGPLITLIIFNTKKKSLKFDLTVIALIQLAALCYGVYTMYLARPVYVVFSSGQFIVVPANDTEPKMLGLSTRPEFKSVPIAGPKYVFSDPPSSYKDPSALLLSMVGLAPQFYAPYGEKSATATKEGKPLQELLKRKPNAQAAVDETLKQAQRNAADVVYFPMTAKTMPLTALADGKTGAILAVLPINPQ